MDNLFQKTALIVSPIAIAGIMLVQSVSATTSFTVAPGIYDPGNTCPGIVGAWDNTTGNPAPSIKLTKPCPTATNAASFADIVAPSLEGQPVSNLTELNFDYQNGGHCGAGAPRFNLQLDQAGSQNAFLGCAGGTQTDLGNGWTHVEFNSAQIAAAITSAGGSPTSTLYDLYIVFDEGTDTPTGGTIGTAGQVNIDNISVNNTVVGEPAPSTTPSPSPTPNLPTSKDQCMKGGWQTFGVFKNQGDCVSFVATHGKNQPANTATPSPSPS